MFDFHQEYDLKMCKKLTRKLKKKFILNQSKKNYSK